MELPTEVIKKEIPFNTKEIKEILKKISEDKLKTNENLVIGTKLGELIREKPNPNNFMRECSTYKQIYALGDLHADYASFYKRLGNHGIIKEPTIPKKISERMFGINKQAAVDNLVRQATEFTWTADEGTLLVICGDIVDGKREFKDRDTGVLSIHEVDDDHGVFEILLHIFLKNLKFRAMEKKSDVICIFGNHDISLFFPSKTYNFTQKKMNEISNNPVKYVHLSSRETFHFEPEIRTRWLSPFYKNNFYFVFVLANNKIPEIQFVHGALHTDRWESTETDVKKYPLSIYDETIVFQAKSFEYFEEYFHKKKALTDLEIYWKEDGLYDDRDNKTVVWDRVYFGLKENDTACDYKPNTDKSLREGPTIIAGHCQNSKQKYIQTGNEKERPCLNGHRNDCVYPKCYDRTGIPKIIMIDTEMSSCFNHSDDAVGGMRQVEILRISKNETIQSEQPMPYFDKYETIYYDKDTDKTTTFLLNKPFTEKGGNHSRKRRSKQRKKHKKTPKRRQKSM